MNGRRFAGLGAVLVMTGALLVAAGGALAAQPARSSAVAASGMMGSAGSGGMMGGGGGWTGTMGGSWNTGAAAPGPGEAGFVAGTPSSPRVVRILALASLRFAPDSIRVQSGETIRFEVTSMGPVAHEFMVGPAADVAADTAGTPEVADIVMMQTATLDYTFSGPGPFAFACHATGHYEAGMSGTIVVVS